MSHYRLLFLTDELGQVPAVTTLEASLLEISRSNEVKVTAEVHRSMEDDEIPHFADSREETPKEEGYTVKEEDRLRIAKKDVNVDLEKLTGEDPETLSEVDSVDDIGASKRDLPRKESRGNLKEEEPMVVSAEELNEDPNGSQQSPIVAHETTKPNKISDPETKVDFKPLSFEKPNVLQPEIDSKTLDHKPKGIDRDEDNDKLQVGHANGQEDGPVETAKEQTLVPKVAPPPQEPLVQEVIVVHHEKRSRDSKDASSQSHVKLAKKEISGAENSDVILKSSDFDEITRAIERYQKDRDAQEEVESQGAIAKDDPEVEEEAARMRAIRAARRKKLMACPLK